MREFTLGTFKKIYDIVDKKNSEDFEYFIKGLKLNMEILTDYDVNDIIDFVKDQFGINSDCEVCEMTIKEIREMSDFINFIAFTETDLLPKKVLYG